MNVKITGKELKATEAIKEYVAKKLERLEKYFGEEFDVLVTIKTEGSEQVAEIHVTRAEGEMYRAVTAHRDLYAAIDKDIDILEGQIRKMKTKKDKQNMTESIRMKETMQSLEPKNEIEDEIIKTIYYTIKPMAPEDAKLELETKPQNQFLVFINIENQKVNVIYRLKDSKNFGLVEPEA
ncbi:MAG: ribosome hibernation-promoting factor, HPF/YfiA family [Clostridia bacterium]